MNQNDIEHMAQGFPPLHIGKDHEEVVTELANRMLSLQQKLDAVLAENVVSRKAVQTFCDVVGGNTHAICEQVGSDGVRAILAAMNAAGNIPATDALLNAARAEGIYFAANRMLAAWDSGFIDDTPAQAYDISGAVLSAAEFLPDASHGDFKRDFADSIRAEIAAKPRARRQPGRAGAV